MNDENNVKINSTNNYWILQRSPERYRILDELKSADEISWPIAAHNKELEIGDKGLSKNKCSFLK